MLCSLSLNQTNPFYAPPLFRHSGSRIGAYGTYKGSPAGAIPPTASISADLVHLPPRTNSSNTSKSSFMDKLTGNSHISCSSKPPIEVRNGTHMGKSVVFFTAEDYFINLADACKLTLVGRFLRSQE